MQSYLSTQHDPDVTQEQIHADIKKYVFDPDPSSRKW